jgi:anti-sigma B factor antagonist
MKYSIDKQSFYSVITLEEPSLNAILAPSLKSDLIFHKQEGVPAMILDLKDVKFVDSSGLSAILTAHRLWKGDGSFVLTGIEHQSVKKLVTISRLNSIVAITANLEDAIEHIKMERLERELSAGLE